jgi:hypothetical protein
MWYVPGKNYPDELSHNVVAELTGTQFPDNIVLLSGHLDSWVRPHTHVFTLTMDT